MAERGDDDVGDDRGDDDVGETAAPHPRELLRRQRSKFHMAPKQAASSREFNPRHIDPSMVALPVSSWSALSPPLRHVEVPPGLLGLRFQMCGESGYARVNDVRSSPPLIRRVTVRDLLVAVDELSTRELGTPGKVLIPGRCNV